MQEESAAAQDKPFAAMSVVEQGTAERTPSGLPDSAVQRSTLSHLYHDMSQVLKVSWRAEVRFSSWHDVLILFAAMVSAACASSKRDLLSRLVNTFRFFLPSLLSLRTIYLFV